SRLAGGLRQNRSLFRSRYPLDVAAQGGQEQTSHTRETIGTLHTRSPPDRRDIPRGRLGWPSHKEVNRTQTTTHNRVTARHPTQITGGHCGHPTPRETHRHPTDNLVLDGQGIPRM